MEEKIINGVNTAIIENTIGQIESDSSVAKSKFRLHNRWEDCAVSDSAISGFYCANQENTHKTTFRLSADEPELLAGQDTAPNPVEYLLHALSTCLTTTLVYHAAVRGIRIQALESDLEGELDVRGFLGLSSEVRKGFSRISVNFKVKTDEKNIEKLKALSKLSPVFDMVSNGTSININIENSR